MTRNADVAKLRAICLGIAERTGYELVEAVLVKEAAGLYVRICLDAQDGISLDDCERFHKLVKPQLDSFEYDYLEVSSPGIDRPIRTHRDFLRAEGKEVELRLYRPQDGRKAFEGTLVGLDETGFHIQTPEGRKVFARKDVSVVRRTIDVEKIRTTASLAGEESE